MVRHGSKARAWRRLCCATRLWGFRVNWSRDNARQLMHFMRYVVFSMGMRRWWSANSGGSAMMALKWKPARFVPVRPGQQRRRRAAIAPSRLVARL